MLNRDTSSLSIETCSLLSSLENKRYYHSVLSSSHHNLNSDPYQVQSDEEQDDQKEQETVTNQQDLLLYCQTIINQYSTSVYLENKASVARDHLANERTYLAWLRTSLSTISVGIGITQLFRLQQKNAIIPHHPQEQQEARLGQLIGFLFMMISLLFIAFAFIRYFHTQVALTKGYFPASRSTVIIASSILFATMLFMTVTVMLNHP